MALPTSDLRALLTLLLAGGRSPPRHALLDCFASPAELLAAGPEAWLAAGCDELQVARLQTPMHAPWTPPCSGASSPAIT